MFTSEIPYAMLYKKPYNLVATKICIFGYPPAIGQQLTKETQSAQNASARHLQSDEGNRTLRPEGSGAMAFLDGIKQRFQSCHGQKEHMSPITACQASDVIAVS